MLKITKGEVKPIFFRLKKSGITYDDLLKKDKDEIKEILLKEQHNRCAYCTCRIDGTSATIEHYIPRSVDMALSLEYHNLFAVCDITRCFQEDMQTCDVHRKEKDLHIDPRKQSDIDTLSYTHGGTIRSSNPAFAEDIDKTLNLNAARLVNKRREAWQTIMSRSSKKKDQQRTKQQLRKYLSKLQAPDDDTEYAGFLIYMLQKRLRRVS